MLKKVMFALAMVAMASYAGAMTLTADGFTAQGIPTAPVNHDRVGLVNDGSFEFGECGAGSAWTCTTNTTCAWIVDPTPVWGCPAYDGVLCAWLGGFCGTPNSNSFCQDLFIGGNDCSLDWHWMGYVNSACGTVSVTVNGSTIFSHTLQLSEHTYGTWNTASSYGWVPLVSAYQGQTVNLCLKEVACPDGANNDNMLVDYVVLNGCVATEDASMSTVKALY
jgi:hypothetical protein